MLKKALQNVKEKTPLIHNITNYVTVNDCANALIACGGAPVMADDLEEAADITSICAGLVINIGTLNKNTIPSMLAAGKRANGLSRPVVLDPVGAGASALRTETAFKLMEEIDFSVIRGNISEIKIIAGGSGETKGVDANVSDKIDDANINEAVAFAKSLSAKTGAVIAITGAIDIVADEGRAYVIKNGNAMMSAISGTGCVLSAVTAAYVAANPSNVLEAAAAAVCAFGLCGERAFDRLPARSGNLTYKNLIFDELFNLDGETLEEGAKYEVK